MTIKAWGLLAIGVVVTGCSFGMNVAPSDPSKRTHEAARKCTDGVFLPVADSLVAAVGVYNISVSAAAQDKVTMYGVPVDKTAGLTLGITQLVVFGAAATYGYIQAARCTGLQRELHRAADLEAEAQAKPTAAANQPLEAAPGSADDHDAAEGPPARSAANVPSAGSAPPERQLPSWSAFRRMPMPRASAAASAQSDPP
jgi:hypothetical protein